MISVDVLAGSPNADANSEDFIFFDFLSFFDSLSLPMLSVDVPFRGGRFCGQAAFEVFAGKDLREDNSRIPFRGKM